jgi:hypothetical protein
LHNPDQLDKKHLPNNLEVKRRDKMKTRTAHQLSTPVSRGHALTTLFCAAILVFLTSTAPAVPTVDGIFTPSDGYTNVQSISFQLQNGTMVPNPGTMAWTTDAQGNAYVAFVQPLSINDNTYGANAVGWGTGGKKGGHSFGNLTGSDKAHFDLTNGAGQHVLSFNLDYITASTSASSGFASLGVNGGDGGIAGFGIAGLGKSGTGIGNAASILQWGTSLGYNLNTLGFKTFTTDSPATTPVHLNPDGTIDYSQGYTDPANAHGWVFNIEYEVEIAASAFGPSGFGSVTTPAAHDSPSKFGQNTIVVVPEAPTYVLVCVGATLAFFVRMRLKSKALH